MTSYAPDCCYCIPADVTCEKVVHSKPNFVIPLGSHLGYCILMLQVAQTMA